MDKFEVLVITIMLAIFVMFTAVYFVDRSVHNDYVPSSSVDADVMSKDGVTCVDDVNRVSKVRGMSMRPTMFDNNTVMLREYDGRALEEGTIVRYTTGDGSTLHRIDGNYRESGYFVTRGDNNDAAEKVPVENVTHIAIGVLYT